jgi:hypothetical protein
VSSSALQVLLEFCATLLVQNRASRVGAQAVASMISSGASEMLAEKTLPFRLVSQDDRLVTSVSAEC